MEELRSNRNFTEKQHSKALSKMQSYMPQSFKGAILTPFLAQMRGSLKIFTMGSIALSRDGMHAAKGRSRM